MRETIFQAPSHKILSTSKEKSKQAGSRTNANHTMDSSGNESDLARRRDNRQRIVGDSDANVIVSASDDPKGSSNNSVGGSASQMSSLTDEDDNKRAAGAVALVVGDNKKKRDCVDDAEGDNESECSVQLPYKKRGRGRHMKHRHPEQQSHAKSEDGDDPLDLTTVSGQLSQNSHLTPEQAKMAAKREYNRRNAARARIRNKNLMTELQERCTRLTTTTEELERENEILRAQLEIFRGQGAIPGTARAAQRPRQQAASPTMSAQPPPPPPQQHSQVQVQVQPSQQQQLSRSTTMPPCVTDRALQTMLNGARYQLPQQGPTPPTPAIATQLDLLTRILQLQSPQQQSFATVSPSLPPQQQQPIETDERQQQHQALVTALLQGNDAVSDRQTTLGRRNE